jgi:hypothetical protein
MRRNRDVEIEFPWQIETVLAGVAAVASALLVLLGWVFFQYSVGKFPLESVMKTKPSYTTTQFVSSLIS